MGDILFAVGIGDIHCGILGHVLGNPLCRILLGDAGSVLGIQGSQAPVLIHRQVHIGVFHGARHHGFLELQPAALQEGVGKPGRNAQNVCDVAEKQGVL
ncbi:hypothetical protein D3C75_1039100 [compost metagenome]